MSKFRSGCHKLEVEVEDIMVVHDMTDCVDYARMKLEILLHPVFGANQCSMKILFVSECMFNILMSSHSETGIHNAAT